MLHRHLRVPLTTAILDIVHSTTEISGQSLTLVATEPDLIISEAILTIISESRRRFCNNDHELKVSFPDKIIILYQHS